MTASCKTSYLLLILNKFNYCVFIILCYVSFMLYNFVGPYFLSDFGQLCKNPINNEKQCKNAASYFNTVYKVAKGNGHDVPYGCILNQLKLGNKFLFWNPAGIIDSSIDVRIQQLCVYNNQTRKI